MFRDRRKSFLVSAALVGGAMLLTACQDTAKDNGARDSSSAASAGSEAAESGSSAAESGAGGDKGADSTDKGAEEAPGSGADTGDGERQPVTEDQGGSGVDTGDGERTPVGQSCGTNDISWSTRAESQAGGYILIIAKAKPGITCDLAAALPVVAFGSDGTEAGPAEQSAGRQITLTGDTTAYAGLNPKTTTEDGGKELEHIIVSAADDDPNPVSLPVGTITVDKPVVTNWHTAPSDAVPVS
ncbi:DUF4232 domain-containing protein [Streptomyces uncialis]|uniref:DUF4232 domain-containing protein n=1 Tax=Streptomyces uncialis TaxID=1048205 RepID=UPI0022575A09|nr:DUF4232 domain-containing protein [Streptomyces uncialis]MCX4664440.1 DUF4232 domain-containing protein [Streptomyces uncialis]